MHKKKPTLRIGHHLLEGKLVNLAKPLAVIHRLPVTSETEADSDVDMNVDALEDLDNDSGEHRRGTKGEVVWEVQSVVKRKMVFSKRPMPIVDKPAVSSFDMQKGKE